MTDARQLHLGAFMFGTGAFIPGWRLPGASNNNEDFEVFQRIAQDAERAKFDMVFVADNLSCELKDHPSEIAKLEPMTLLAALAVATTKIGLGGTISTSFSEPYNVARMVSSLDHISRGRAAWNVVTASIPTYEANFGHPAQPARHYSHDERYAVADEFVGVVKKLWDSWSDTAFVRNAQSGQFVDSTKVRPIDHDGEYFSVRGPLNSSRPPQGHPVIIQAGSSSVGQQFAASHAEIVFTAQQNLDEAQSFYSQLKELVAGAGRDPRHCHILPGLFPIVAPTRQEAHDKLEDMITYLDERTTMGTISLRFRHDMSQYPLDGPMPVLPEHSSQSKVMFSMAERENLSWRQLYTKMAVGRGYLMPCGSASDVADTIEEWFTGRGCDGFIVTPSHFPEGFGDFTRLVVPELQRRGLFRKDYAGDTLRDHLNLPRPSNTFEA
jgi:FMN-dependent oxidoreductase (nitrilotriacetate monooxygenase family)